MTCFPKKELAYALLGGLYVGSYYATVEGTVGIRSGALSMVPTYRYGGETAAAIYRLWHEVDRYLRPGWWVNVPLK
jgi:hypothetical protein